MRRFDTHTAATRWKHLCHDCHTFANLANMLDLQKPLPVDDLRHATSMFATFAKS
jgi:hypothetical protein